MAISPGCALPAYRAVTQPLPQHSILALQLETFVVLSCSWVYADLESCWSPAPPLIAFCLPLIARRIHCLGPCRGRWSFPWSGMCHSPYCFGARFLGSIWGVEVPGHPVLGSLHSPSTWRGVTLGGSRLQGCHGYLPFGLWFCSPLTFPAPVPKLIYCDEFKCG